MRRTTARSMGLALVATGLVAAALSAATFIGVVPAGATDLAGFDLASDARGVSIFTVIPQQEQAQPELNIPQASTTLQSGIGYGLASVAWPGPTIANGGSVLSLVIPGFPAALGALLIDPIRAESRTGQEPPTTVFDLPGLTMRARAVADSVEAEAGAQGVAVLPGVFGVARSSGASTASTSLAKATARSTVQNLTVGPLHIGAIVSTAMATSDGDKGAGSASTEVSGVTVGGQKATIDSNGIHVGASNTPLAGPVAQLNKALAQAGVKVTMGPPTHEINGAQSIQSASSLVITLTQQGNTVGIVVGGARARAFASSGDDAIDELLGDSTDFAGGAVGSDGVGGFSDVGGFDPSLGGDAGSSGSGSGSGAARPSVNFVRSGAIAKGRPLSKASIALGVIAALFIAAGLRRLNTAVLADPTAGVACTLPGEGE